jgi:hypothetical protein
LDTRAKIHRATVRGADWIEVEIAVLGGIHANALDLHEQMGRLLGADLAESVHQKEYPKENQGYGKNRFTFRFHSFREISDYSFTICDAACKKLLVASKSRGSRRRRCGHVVKAAGLCGYPTRKFQIPDKIYQCCIQFGIEVECRHLRAGNHVMKNIFFVTTSSIQTDADPVGRSGDIAFSDH